MKQKYIKYCKQFKCYYKTHLKTLNKLTSVNLND